MRVAAVCGNELRIYGSESSGRRPLLSVEVCRHYGEARDKAQEFDERERVSEARGHFSPPPAAKREG